MAIPLAPGCDSQAHSTFDFRQGMVEVWEAAERKVLRGLHHCTAEIGSGQSIPMNFRIGRGVTKNFCASLSCPQCLFRVEFNWGLEMPFGEVERQLKLAADCSWATLDTYPGSDSL